MRRDAGRHANRDARRAVGQQVREGGGQHHRLFLFAVIGLAEIDGVQVDAVEQRPRDGGHARFGVTHRRRVIAVDIAEIALAVDQRIALREALREAHKCVVDRLVAMRVIFADDVADHARAFLEARAGVELELAHGEEHAPVHGLEAVAHVGQRAVHDGRKGVSQVALFKRVLQLDGLHGRREENRFVSHASEVAARARRAKMRLRYCTSASVLHIDVGRCAAPPQTDHGNAHPEPTCKSAELAKRFGAMTRTRTSPRTHPHDKYGRDDGAGPATEYERLVRRKAASTAAGSAARSCSTQSQRKPSPMREACRTRWFVA